MACHFLCRLFFFVVTLDAGPFSVNADKHTLRQNPGSWNEQFSMLYIDNPVGVGFSFTNDNSGFSTSSRFDVVRPKAFALLLSLLF